MLIGYARVSTTDQDLSSQEDVLKSAGCEKIYTDVVSGLRPLDQACILRCPICAKAICWLCGDLIA